jgi:hypothetical protein
MVGQKRLNMDREHREKNQTVRALLHVYFALSWSLHLIGLRLRGGERGGGSTVRYFSKLDQNPLS